MLPDAPSGNSGQNPRPHCHHATRDEWGQMPSRTSDMAVDVTNGDVKGAAGWAGMGGDGLRIWRLAGSQGAAMSSSTTRAR